MENVQVAPIAEPSREHAREHAVGVGGSAVEALAGLGAVVLSILGLAGPIVVPFASIAMIAAGAALLFEAAAVGARSARPHVAAGEIERTVVKSAIGSDAIAGLGAVTLGILALIGISPVTLLPVGAILLGAGLLLSAGGPTVLSGRHGSGRAEVLAHDALAASSGVHALVGAGALILGIIGVIGSTPMLMTLIATLSVGAAQLLTGASIGGRMASHLRHGT